MPAPAAPEEVKAEQVEDTADPNKDIEQPDFGGEEEALPVAPAAKEEVQRTVPDYADLIDDEGIVSIKKKVAKKEEPEEKGEPRPDAILVSGVERLTRTHIAEVLDSKNLPRFERVDWISDDRLVCIFKDAQAATIALAGCLRGFEEGDERPGPGLWRAVRGMLDFRQAMATDVPGPNFKKWHRAGRQVRDYRFWEAAKDIDRNILDDLEQKGTKRDAPTGEDAIAAAVYASELGEAPRKKRRKNKGPVEEEEAPDILQQMAQKDRELMALKEEVVQPEEEPPTEPAPAAAEGVAPEAAPASSSTPAATAAPVDTGEGEAISAVCDVVPQERWEDSWFAQQAKNSRPKGRGGEEPWGRHAKADDLEAREDAGEQGGRREGRRRGGADTNWRHDLYNYANERERQARNRGSWGHDDRGGGWGGPDVRDREAPRKRGRGYEDQHDWDRGQDWQSRPNNAGGASNAAPPEKPADDEEARKRRKRMERFSKAAPAAAHGDDAAPS